jgi:pyrimidine-nucleoside phosphorylase
MMIDRFDKSNFEEIVRLALNKRLSNEDIAYIAVAMANSGETLSFDNNSFIDIPSTGGPSSLSTLVCPYILIACGEKVLKLGVKGRPAGGIDVLAQIANYQIHFTSNEIYNILDNCGYCHFIADSHFTPLDADFFKYRSDHNAKAIPELVIASILAKKIAVGVNNVGLDLRYYKGGNFGKGINEAYLNGQLFIAVAKLLNIKAKIFLNNLNQPLQPFIGRGESLVALKNIFENNMNLWLKKHFDNCLKIAFSLCSKNAIKDFRIDSLFAGFKNNLKAQGCRVDDFFQKTDKIERANRIPIQASKCGFLKIDLVLLRDIMVKYQNRATNENFPDNIGLILNKQHSEYVNKGDCIALLRICPEDKTVYNEISSAFIISLLPTYETINNNYDILIF